MKIRNGFVSNSSSSSFVVAFPKEPKSVHDVEKILFDDGQEFFLHPYDDDKQYVIRQVAETVWRDIQDQKPNDMEKVKESVRNGWFESYDGLQGHVDEYRNPFDSMEYSTNGLDYKKDNEKIQEIWEKQRVETDCRAEAISERFMKKCRGMYVYVFEYADGDGSYFSALEHGNLFKNLHNIRTSYH